jgi:hypothetical protein
MKDYLESVIDALVERTPQELIAAVIISLVISLVLAGLYRLARRRMSDPLTLVSSLMLLGCTVSMVLAAGYGRYRLGIGRVSNVPPSSHERWEPPPQPPELVVQRLVAEADFNNDGVITREEAAQAAESFVRNAETGERGRLDRDSLSLALRDLLGPHRDGHGPPPGPSSPPMSPPSRYAAKLERSSPEPAQEPGLHPGRVFCFHTG